MPLDGRPHRRKIHSLWNQQVVTNRTALVETRAQHIQLRVSFFTSRYGAVRPDLDRIMEATSSYEVMKIVNEVLAVLSHCGRMEEIPLAIRPQPFQCAHEIPETVLANVAGIQPPNDAIVVLQSYSEPLARNSTC